MDIERPARSISPVDASELAKRLRDGTPAIIEHLSGISPGILHWRFETRDEMTREWNRAQVGPSTEAVWSLLPDISGAEASVRLETIRWSPIEVHRREVIGHWRVPGRTATFFARAEGEAVVTEVRTDAAVWNSVWGLGLPKPFR